MPSSHQHQHSHSCCGHHTDNHKTLLILFILGLVSFLSAFFIENKIIQAVLNLLAIVLAGGHVIAGGILDTVNNSLAKKRFMPNIHLLMTVAAIGAIIIQEYSEAALLILIFAGAHHFSCSRVKYFSDLQLNQHEY